ncbi:MAG: N-acetyltransferase [Chitinophagaceae bacterium]|nr:MAG: N-acetyltransferase [Chitinophagaceae bacterium]
METEIHYNLLCSIDTVTTLERLKIVDFLYNHLDEYGDTKEDIGKALDYALSDFHHQGGFVVVASENDKIVGCVVMLQTGMEGYVPENLLVYISVHGDMRGRGVGKQLMEKAIKFSQGNIALHVEPDNPARFLYEKMGFTTKYQEMRLVKEKSK